MATAVANATTSGQRDVVNASAYKQHEDPLHLSRNGTDAVQAMTLEQALHREDVLASHRPGHHEHLHVRHHYVRDSHGHIHRIDTLERDHPPNAEVVAVFYFIMGFMIAAQVIQGNPLQTLITSPTRT